MLSSNLECLGDRSSSGEPGSLPSAVLKFCRCKMSKIAAQTRQLFPPSLLDVDSSTSQRFLAASNPGYIYSLLWLICCYPYIQSSGNILIMRNDIQRLCCGQRLRSNSYHCKRFIEVTRNNTSGIIHRPM